MWSRFRFSGVFPEKSPAFHSFGHFFESGLPGASSMKKEMGCQVRPRVVFSTVR
jgi:hypothetical protein